MSEDRLHSMIEDRLERMDQEFSLVDLLLGTTDQGRDDPSIVELLLDEGIDLEDAA